AGYAITQAMSFRARVRAAPAGIPEEQTKKRPAAASGPSRLCTAETLFGVADLDGLHRTLGLGAAVIDRSHGADDRVFARGRLLVDDLAALRLDVLHDVVRCRGGLRRGRQRKADKKRAGKCNIDLH